jgi:hypothetical protein
MNKLLTATLGLAVAALPVFAMAPAAFAAGNDPSCEQAKRTASRLEVRLAAVISDENAAEKAALEQAKAALAAAQKALDEALPGVDLGPLKATRDAAKGAVDAAKAALTTDSKRLADLRVELKTAQTERDKACDDSTPTTTPAPTTTSAPTTTPAPADDEEEVTLAPPARVVVPNGGVNTGVGPA